MTLRILAFGIAADLVGGRTIELEVPEDLTSDGLRGLLNERFAGLAHLSSYAIAINQCYSLPDDRIGPADQLAILPPVSGG